MLRYNFPGDGLGEAALRTLVLMVLAAGVDARRGLLDQPFLRRSRCGALPAAAVRADAEQFDGVTHLGNPCAWSHFGRPGLDFAAADLDGRSAAAAHQMVVMVVGGAASVDRLAGVGAHHVDQIGGR